MTAGIRKRVVIHEDDVGMSHGANTAFLELSRLGHLQLGLGDGALSLVPRGRRDRGPASRARPRHPPDADQRAEALSLAPADRAAALGRHDRRAAAISGRTCRGRGGQHPRRSRPSCGAQIEVALAAGIDADPSRRPYGHGADAGVRPILPPARPRVPAAGPAGRRASSRYNPASYAGPLDHGRLRRRGGGGAGGGRARLRHRARDALGAEDRCRDRLPRDVRDDPGWASPSCPCTSTSPAISRRSTRRTAHIRTEEYALFRTPGSASGSRNSGSR